MMEEQKKMAAAMAAVMACIRDGEAAALRRLGASPQRPAGKQPKNIWSTAGRMDQMQTAQYMQRKS
ncbi:hypothetical protein [Desulfobotulus mexicanus]|uniref:Uncharacterized protein n=1 Tax=Desulfobotulus mexicanus TaxID=2586642 RepID=A0A5Q4VC89_9BACT|nr:hypothetical protein [Desulfobotulus mexicanus]TYT75155.1 hypothetical protein FIM25_05420 [Desulfobotulus mexicanus]